MKEADWCALNNEITSQLESPDGAIYDFNEDELDGKSGVDAALSYMNVCISKAVEKYVPNRCESTSVKRRVSCTTRALYEKRASLFSAVDAKGDKISKSMRARWNKRIKQTNLSDYNT